MPEISVSYSSLWAVAATSILAAVGAHLLLVRAGTLPESRRKQRRRSRSKRSELEPPLEKIPSDVFSDEDDSSIDSYAAVPPPPKPVAGPTSPRRRRRSSGRDAAKVNIYSPTGSDALVNGASEWGWSMEDARARAEEIESAKSLRSPREVLEDLQKGNARFWTGVANRPELSAFERRALIKQQFPSVAVLGCSDSRVPVEIVFDQGLGDMFVIRVAGNHLDNATHGSLQAAIWNLKVKVVVVLGHEGCGAIKHAMDPQDVIDKQPKQLSHMLSQIKGHLDEDMLSSLTDMKARDREAVVTNVKKQVEELTRDRAVTKKVEDNKLLIVGAFYEISSGIVDFFHEVSAPLSDEEPEAAGGNDEIPIQRLPSRGVQTRYDLKTQEVISPNRRKSTL